MKKYFEMCRDGCNSCNMLTGNISKMVCDKNTFKELLKIVNLKI